MAPDRKDNNYQKAAYYCSCQERTEHEVRIKLHLWKVGQDEIVCIIQKLKENRFLDEERYIEEFIRVMCFVKKWGKRKLWATLKKKGLSEVLIKKGLTTIEDSRYLQGLHHVAEKKRQLLVEANSVKAKQKLTNYLLQKGYEYDLVMATVQKTLQ